MYRKKSSPTIQIATSSSLKNSNVSKTNLSSSSSTKNIKNKKYGKIYDKQNQSNNCLSSKKKQQIHTNTLLNVKKLKERALTKNDNKKTNRLLNTNAKNQSKKTNQQAVQSKKESFQKSVIKGQSSRVTNSIQEIQKRLMISMFKIGKKIQQSIFSCTFEAQCLQTGLIVSLKIFNKDKAKKQGYQARILEQIRFRVRNRHHNIQHLYGLFADQINIYIIQQFMSSRQDPQLISLSRKLHKCKKIPEKNSFTIFKQLLSILEFIHAQRYCLRDIQISNIYQFFGVYKLTNFNWITQMSKNRQRNTFCGSIKNAPPQLLRGEEYNQNIDIWQLGLFLYTLVVGIHPFEGKERTLIPQGIKIIDELNFPIFLSNQIVDFIAKILQCKNNRMKLEDMGGHSWLLKWQDNDFISKEFWNFWGIRKTI